MDKQEYKPTKKDSEVVGGVVKDLFKLMGLKAKPKISVDKDNKAILVDIKADEESGLLIGARGDTLNALQSVIGMIVRKKLDKWVRVIVNVADWRDKQEEKMISLADSTVERVKATNEEQSLFNLNPNQRRIIHTHLVDNKDVVTESKGEGEDRYLVVKPANTKE